MYYLLFRYIWHDHYFYIKKKLQQNTYNIFKEIFPKIPDKKTMKFQAYLFPPFFLQNVKTIYCMFYKLPDL